jgi:hyperosmotically inducible periplasmic protein
MSCAVASSLAFSDEASYAPSAPAYAVHPSSAAVARKAMKQADRLLARSVRKAIAAHGGVVMTRITVLARSGKVTLVGSVPENDQIDVARDRAKSVAGVTEVVDNLTLRLPGH